MSRIRFCVAVLLLSRFVCHAATSGADREETRTFVVYSMRAAEAIVKAAKAKGRDFRDNTDLNLLGGITKPKAVILDPAGNDILLIGEADKNSAVLSLDDWVVALRTRSFRPNEDPGVSIDPIAEGTQARDSKKVLLNATKQQVNFFGQIDNTHFGEICYRADWLLKTIAFGIQKLPIPDFKNHHDLFIEDARYRVPPFFVVSRFWFYPTTCDVTFFDNVALLESFRMGVFSQVDYAEIGGAAVENADTMLGQSSDEFSRSFTAHYDSIANHLEVLKTLQGLTRLAGLAKAATKSAQFRTLAQYFLQEYPVKAVAFDHILDILQVSDQKMNCRFRGGARLMAITFTPKEGNVDALRDSSLKLRPTSSALKWTITLHFRNGSIIGVQLPNLSQEQKQLSELIQHASLSYQKARYEDAVQAWIDILNLKAARETEYYGLAQYSLGFCHANGQGLAKDSVEAVEWYRKAAEQNCSPAQCNLGVCYSNGTGVEKDYSDAVKWYRRAAEQNFAVAQNNLGTCYQKGKGVEKNLLEATSWYRKAAGQNLAAAQFNLGACYEAGDGVERDLAEATKWYSKAAEQNFAAAQFNLGGCYERGDGVAMNRIEAMKWYRKAAEQNYAVAQNNLGIGYKNGNGVTIDYVEAYKWLLLAMAQGQENAMKNVFVTEELMAKDQIEEGKQRALNFRPQLNRTTESDGSNEEGQLHLNP